jgi:hypothetical protein
MRRHDSLPKPTRDLPVTTDALLVEQIRQALPDVAPPASPGEPVAAWLTRASRACAIPASRLRAFWHRRVDSATAAEYIAVMQAAAKAAARRQAIAELEHDIEIRTAALVADTARLSALSPALARLAPVALEAMARAAVDQKEPLT